MIHHSTQNVHCVLKVYYSSQKVPEGATIIYLFYVSYI
jgi:hypothetical protein